MVINTFHGRQDHTFTKISKVYNQITTRVLINNDRFRVVWRSQCICGQKRERRERPIKITAHMQKDLAERKTHFNSHCIYYVF